MLLGWISHQSIHNSFLCLVWKIAKLQEQRLVRGEGNGGPSVHSCGHKFHQPLNFWFEAANRIVIRIIFQDLYYYLNDRISKFLTSEFAMALFSLKRYLSWSLDILQ